MRRGRAAQGGTGACEARAAPSAGMIVGFAQLAQACAWAATPTARPPTQRGSALHHSPLGEAVDDDQLVARRGNGLVKVFLRHLPQVLALHGRGGGLGLRCRAARRGGCRGRRERRRSGGGGGGGAGVGPAALEAGAQEPTPSKRPASPLGASPVEPGRDDSCRRAPRPALNSCMALRSASLLARGARARGRGARGAATPHARWSLQGAGWQRVSTPGITTTCVRAGWGSPHLTAQVRLAMALCELRGWISAEQVGGRCWKLGQRCQGPWLKAAAISAPRWRAACGHPDGQRLPLRALVAAGL